MQLSNLSDLCVGKVNASAIRSAESGDFAQLEEILRTQKNPESLTLLQQQVIQRIRRLQRRIHDSGQLITASAAVLRLETADSLVGKAVRTLTEAASEDHQWNVRQARRDGESNPLQ